MPPRHQPTATQHGAPKASLPEQIFLSVQTALMSGHFAPGQRLPLRTIAGSFGTSTMPAREALSRLVALGALEILPSRRVVVPTPTTERLQDILRARAIVEPEIAIQALNRLESDQIRRVRQSVAALSAMMRSTRRGKRDLSKWAALHRELFFEIYEAAESPTLLGIIKSFWIQVGPSISVIGARMSSASAYEDILNSLEAHSHDRLREAIRSTIEMESNLLQQPRGTL